VSSTSATTHITIRRQSPPDDVGLREVYVLLDGQEIAVLKAGESVTREVSPGPHRLRAHNTLFWRTHDITLSPGSHLRFSAVNSAGWGMLGLMGSIGVAPLYLRFTLDD
jgi:hypothetical protein